MNIRGFVCGAVLAALIAPSSGWGWPAAVVAVLCVGGCSLMAARVDRRVKAGRRG